MDQTLKIQPNSLLTTEALNNSIIGLFNIINSINYINTIGPAASTTVSGSVLFTDTIASGSVSGIFPAVSPYSLNSIPMSLNTYFGNSISTMVTGPGTTMQYILLPNKVILMFGMVSSTTSSIYLKDLFSNTPYTLSALYFINIGGGEMGHTTSALPIITYMTKDTITIAPMLAYTNPASSSARNINWYALGKIA